MATAEQLKALIRSHADDDDTRFFAVALQVAAQAARSGHGKLAQELRRLVDEAKAKTKAVEAVRGAQPPPMAQPRGELAGLLTVAYPKTRVEDMALSPELHTRIERVLLEQHQRAHSRARVLPAAQASADRPARYWQDHDGICPRR